jgi:hypothetical protein
VSIDLEYIAKGLSPKARCDCMSYANPVFYICFYITEASMRHPKRQISVAFYPNETKNIDKYAGLEGVGRSEFIREIVRSHMFDLMVKHKDPQIGHITYAELAEIMRGHNNAA